MKINKDVKRIINQIAGKLAAEGLTYSQYTKAKAKYRLRNVVAPKVVYRAVDAFSPEIKKELKRLTKKR